MTTPIAASITAIDATNRMRNPTRESPIPCTSSRG